MTDFTAQQREAIAGHGNLLVVAGAGTGKTHTLVSRCLRCVTEEHASLDGLLMVTFTEAAAAEMRARIRQELRLLQATRPDDEHLVQQLALLDTARICTLHGFCRQLSREHFQELGLDPQFSVLDEQQTRPLMRRALDELLEERYAREDAEGRAVQALVRTLGRGSDARVRKLVLKLHAHSQSLPDPARWLDEQQARFERTEPDEWRQCFLDAVSEWREEFLDQVASLANRAKAVKLGLEALRALPPKPDAAGVAGVLRTIQAADHVKNWPRGSKGTVRKALKEFYDGADFFASLLPDAQGNDPLAQDWKWVRHHLLALVALTREFTTRFTAAKRELAGVDFADLEQCALRLLRTPAIANEWRARLAQVFVDEYQDINAAQDAIITALSRTGAAANRFMVGDVKQSIYRFRLANPKIFGDYDKRWSQPDADGRRLPLTENFRSREALLNFVNLFFSAVMRPPVGGVPYEALQFGAPVARGALTQKPGDPPCVEMHLIARADEEDGMDEPASESGEEKVIPDLPAVQREARLVARRLRELKEKHHQTWDAERKAFRHVEWGDMAVLLRSPSGRAEAFAMEFSKAGVPLIAARDGFFASLEVSDLLHLLRLLDNPLQDVPLAAVLRSPLVGLTLDDLAQVRAHNNSRPFWTALARFHEVRSLESRVQGPGSGIQNPESENALRAKVSQFFEQYRRWRELVRHTSLSQCLETALTETHYETLLLAGARGHERMANVRRLLDLARHFDPYQRQGLYRFLRLVEAQAEEELDLQPEPAPAEDAVRLMSIHKSKGLEFPVVALACLGTRFNERDLNEPVSLNEHYGPCPRITPPDAEHNYPSLTYWVARRGERRELRGEELRLLYVAMTRARDSLILVGSTNQKGGKAKWASEPQSPVNTRDVVRAHSHLDWLLKWLPGITVDTDWRDDRTGENKVLRWRVYDENDAAFGDGVPPPPVAATGSGGDNVTDVALVEQLKVKLAWRYPFEAAVSEAAKTSVSALRRRAVDESDEEARRVFGARAGKRPTRTRATSNSAQLSATERGNVYHLFLQLLDLERAAGEAELKAEAQRFLETGRMNQAQVGALDFAAINQFWQSDLGQRIRSNAACVRRELAFTARYAPRELAAITGEPITALNEDFVVVQGVVDLAVLRADGIWLVDFKTDETAMDEVSAKVELYEPQLRLYALALERVCRRPITESWLHFLAVPKTVRLFPPHQRYNQGELF